jgi:hypothetical protein
MPKFRTYHHTSVPVTVPLMLIISTDLLLLYLIMARSCIDDCRNWPTFQSCLLPPSLTAVRTTIRLLVIRMEMWAYRQNVSGTWSFSHLFRSHLLFATACSNFADLKLVSPKSQIDVILDLTEWADQKHLARPSSECSQSLSLGSLSNLHKCMPNCYLSAVYLLL